MAGDKHIPIPHRNKVLDHRDVELSLPWRQFFNQIFDDIYIKIAALEVRIAANEVTLADHEARITTLEP